jgi:opacity protein-like surface antigen
MKRSLFTIFLLFVIAAPAFAGTGPVYGGLSLGPSSIASSSSTAIGLTLGYRLENVKLGRNGNLAVEGQYTSLGSAYGGNFSSIGVDAVALFPIQGSKDISLFGKLGLNTIHGDFACGPLCSYSTSSGLVLDVGFGAQFKLRPKIDLRVGYQYYDTNFDAIYAAALFNF